MSARVVALAAALAALVISPAAAADRSSISTVPKPVASGVPWTPEASESLRRDLNAIVSSAPALRGAHTGILAIDTASGLPLYELHADDAFQPASTLKLLTGSVALARLGPAYRLRTTLSWNAPVLTLHAGGDALLAAADLDAAARAAARAGVRDVWKLDVDVARYDRAKYLPGWTWDDFPYSYAPAISAAALEENSVHLVVAPGVRPGVPPTVHLAPDGNHVVIRNAARTVAADAEKTLDIERDGDVVVITGAVPVGSDPEDLLPAVPDPAAFMRGVLSAALERAGVRVRNPAPAVAFGGGSGAPLGVWSHDGEPLGDLLADLWYPSDNLIGELLLKELSAVAGAGAGTTAAGIALEQDWLRSIGVDPAAAALSDGSGLSTYDRISPRVLAAILQYDWSSPMRDIILDALPVAAVRGTLADAYTATPIAGRVFAKTGSFSHVSALAGYLRPRCRGAVTFVFTVDDFVGISSALSEVRGQVLARMIDDPC